MSIILGQHYLVEYEGCDANYLRVLKTTEPLLLEAVNRSGATYVSHMSHQFEPEGVSMIVMIEESHFSLHTWPEHSFASLDIFTCGEMDATIAIEYLSTVFRSSDTRVRAFDRGIGI
jgi:S-adenosylmethionine decarboxylase proenzyme